MTSRTGASLSRAAAYAAAITLIVSRLSAAQTLAVNGDHFAINGAGRFLVFVSYFHGLDRPSATLSSDLTWFKSKGVEGVRIWPNASTPPLMGPYGALNRTTLQKLRSLVDQASARGMLVDVTFTRESIPGLTMAQYRAAIAATAGALRDRRNIVFDLQNEWNCQAAQNGMTISALTNIRAAVGSAHPTLVVTASHSCHPDAAAGATALDVLAYHGPRDSAGAWADSTDDLVAALRSQLALAGGRVAPIYLQEPNRFRYAFDPSRYYDNNTAHYWMSARNAKRAGAAAWTFHTAASFDLSSSILFSDLLLGGERAVLEGLSAQLAAESVWGIRTPARTVPNDYDGDGRTDIATYQPSTAAWRVLLSSRGTGTQTVWGAPADVPVPGDYDGDGMTDAAIYRPWNATWFVTLSNSGRSAARVWGADADIPVPGDYDGDGTTDLAVYRPSTAIWFIAHSSGRTTAMVWGADADIPVPGDYDGDGKSDIAVYRPLSATWFVAFASGRTAAMAWGAPADAPVPGDYDGDGMTDIAVYRPASATWFIVLSSGGHTGLVFGSPTDVPVPGDYDGDGTTDIATYRPSNATWQFLLSGGGPSPKVVWGTATDIPLTLAPRP